MTGVHMQGMEKDQKTDTPNLTGHLANVGLRFEVWALCGCVEAQQQIQGTEFKVDRRMWGEGLTKL